MSADWPFADPMNVASITTRQVLKENCPIRIVSHDEDDGCWQFLCGTTDDPDDSMVVALERIVEHDPSIRELADLPLGWKAWRDSPAGLWQRGQVETDGWSEP